MKWYKSSLSKDYIIYAKGEGLNKEGIVFTEYNGSISIELGKIKIFGSIEEITEEEFNIATKQLIENIKQKLTYYVDN
jgi:hypothetical protein